jgi:hypothetical protein
VSNVLKDTNYVQCPEITGIYERHQLCPTSNIHYKNATWKGYRCKRMERQITENDDALEALGEIAEGISVDMKALSARLTQFKNTLNKYVKKSDKIRNSMQQSLDVAFQNHSALMDRCKELEGRVRVGNIEKVESVVDTKRKREEDDVEEEVVEKRKIERVEALLGRQDLMFDEATMRECASCKKVTLPFYGKMTGSTTQDLSGLRVAASRKQGIIVLLQVEYFLMCFTYRMLLTGLYAGGLLQMRSMQTYWEDFLRKIACLDYRDLRF